ncbi:hypothetical protein BpHYR1_031066 [Brachionus plicatilis]|uniref:Uncharacterized protein n=1 Tax=Brachionus plicatilis TaxID=10195 RepID=A0A3M7RX86_BRAPC|nr:hypothetical protein BpHYR1_031066 [Brachionus plicatilis]
MDELVYSLNDDFYEYKMDTNLILVELSSNAKTHIGEDFCSNTTIEKLKICSVIVSLSLLKS